MTSFWQLLAKVLPPRAKYWVIARSIEELRDVDIVPESSMRDVLAALAMRMHHLEDE